MGSCSKQCAKETDDSRPQKLTMCVCVIFSSPLLWGSAFYTFTWSSSPSPLRFSSPLRPPSVVSSPRNRVQSPNSWSRWLCRAVVHSPRTRLQSPNSWSQWLCRAVVHSPRTRLQSPNSWSQWLWTFSYAIFCRASGEAILGTQRYFIKALYPVLYQSTLSKHFIKALYPSTLSKHFIQALYPTTLSKHFTKALCPSTLSKHFIKHVCTTYLTLGSN